MISKVKSRKKRELYFGMTVCKRNNYQGGALTFTSQNALSREKEREPPVLYIGKNLILSSKIDLIFHLFFCRLHGKSHVCRRINFDFQGNEEKSRKKAKLYFVMTVCKWNNYHVAAVIFLESESGCTHKRREGATCPSNWTNSLHFNSI